MYAAAFDALIVADIGTEPLSEEIVLVLLSGETFASELPSVLVRPHVLTAKFHGAVPSFATSRLKFKPTFKFVFCRAFTAAELAFPLVISVRILGSLITVSPSAVVTFAREILLVSNCTESVFTLNFGLNTGMATESFGMGRVRLESPTALKLSVILPCTAKGSDVFPDRLWTIFTKLRMVSYGTTKFIAFDAFSFAAMDSPLFVATVNEGGFSTLSVPSYSILADIPAIDRETGYGFEIE